MVDEVVENVFLVNAPAGSGKTTWIKHQVENYLLNNPNDNVLCITYTNRAAEELGRDLDSKRVYIGTIHSFINDFIGSFFSHSAIIDLYWNNYKEQVKERIDNMERKDNWTANNERYKEKYGEINMDTVHRNIEKISYGESPFTSFYRGALSHDDLISFTRCAVDKFPVIKKKISDKYQLIFIDEYQDTAADVLHIFYESVVGKKCNLYLLGDKMQQIYKNYNGEFEEKFKNLNKSVRLSTNYRATPKIVDILNNLYNDDTLKQDSYKKNSNSEMSFSPKIIITSDVTKKISEFRKKYEDALVLYISNKDRFHNIGVGELYDSYSKMKKYAFGTKYSAVDILTKEESRTNDALLSFLFMVNQVIKDYEQERYGEVFRSIRKHQVYCNSEKYIIKRHVDKSSVKTNIETIVNSYNNSIMSIDGFLNICLEVDFIKKEYYSAIVDDPDYQLVKDIGVQEVKILAEYLNDPRVSTQHGVKGESHDTVVFVAENSSNPAVHMMKFFELWSNFNITLSEFDDFYYQYRGMLQEIESIIGIKCSELKKDTYESVARIIDGAIRSFALKNETNNYYIHLLKDKVDKYISKSSSTSARGCLNENIVYGPLCAYRLFYVGCSRARKNLVIMINKADIVTFEGKLREKFHKCGFEVE